MMEQAQHTIPHLRKIREVQTAIRQDATAWTAQVYEASVRACLLARDARELHVSLTRLIHHIYPRMHRSMDKVPHLAVWSHLSDLFALAH